MTATIQPSDSLSRRYLARLVASVVGLPLVGLTQALFARAGGPILLGDFAFLTKIAQDLLTFLDCGACNAFFSKFSHNPSRAALVRFYLWVVICCCAGLFLVAGIVHLTPLREQLWPGTSLAVVALASLYAALLWFTQFIQSVIDARGRTVAGEKVRVGHRALVLGIVAGAYFWLGSFSTLEFFLLNCVVVALFPLLLWKWGLGRSDRGLFCDTELRTAEDSPRELLRSFATFCLPMVTYAVVGFGIALIDRWVLQRAGGSVQQGYFALSAQIGVIAFLCTSSMSALLTRELSWAVGQGDRERMRSLFLETSMALYAIAAAIGIFAWSERKAITRLFGGGQFEGAELAVALMMLYPLHQTFGQLNASVFFAEGRTASYRNIGILVGLAGVPLSLWFLLPTSRGGVELGATGLAAKMLIMQLIHVNLQLFVISRWLKFSFLSVIWRQLKLPLVIFPLVLIASWTGDRASLGYAFDGFLVSGAVYCVLVIGMVLLAPQLLDIRRERIKVLSDRIREMRR